MSTRSSPRLFGVLVTYRRPDDLARYLAVLRAQPQALELLVVVDNAPTPETDAIVRRHAAERPTVHVRSTTNVGPAGGIAAGMRAVLTAANDEDWVTLLDDDNPPQRDDQLEVLFTLARTQRGHERVAGVGLVGQRFDWRRARLVRLLDGQLEGVVDVDCIGGNQFPMYRIAAIRDVGVFREALFWGLEELDFGLRLRAAGYRIVIDGGLATWARTFHGRLAHGPPKASAGSTRVAWRQYYVVRNMIDILRSHGHSVVAARVALARGLGKAVVAAARDPRGAAPKLGLAARAVRDGWRGRLGRSIEPEDWAL